jgi:raffinose/stachyose/melibiose transport system substrate-binding protein
MKRAVVLVLTMVLAAGLLYANGQQQAAEAEGPVTLDLYTALDLASPQADNFTAIMDAFHDAHPDVQLEMEALHGEPYHTKLKVMASSGELPDVMRLWPGSRSAFVTQNGLAEDLRPFLDGRESEFAKMAVAPQGPNGEIYELPVFITTTHVVFANEKLMEELDLEFPETFEELVAQGETIRDAGYVPIAMSNKAGWQMQSLLLGTLVERAGGQEWFDNAITGDGASFADEPFVQALSIIKELNDRELFPNGVNQLDYSQATELFVQEEAVYYIDGGWKVNELNETLSEEQQARVSLHSFPDIPNQQGRSGSVSAVPGSGFGMRTGLSEAEQQAAWEWIWFNAGPEGSEMRLKQGSYIPAYKMDVDQYDLDPLLGELAALMQRSPTTHVMDNVLDGEGMTLLQSGMQEMMFGAKSPEQLAQEYEEWVAANDSNRQ